MQEWPYLPSRVQFSLPWAQVGHRYPRAPGFLPSASPVPISGHQVCRMLRMTWCKQCEPPGADESQTRLCYKQSRVMSWGTPDLCPQSFSEASELTKPMASLSGSAPCVGGWLITLRRQTASGWSWPQDPAQLYWLGSASPPWAPLLAQELWPFPFSRMMAFSSSDLLQKLHSLFPESPFRGFCLALQESQTIAEWMLANSYVLCFGSSSSSWKFL